MYKPVRPRPKKTNIVRSRNGCKRCRERKTKCDEQKPSCETCTRLGRDCEPVSQNLRFKVVSGLALRDSSPKRDAESFYTTAGEEISQERLDISSMRITNLDLIRPLQHTDRDVFYSTYWEDVCLPAVHPMFQSISLTAWGDAMFKDAILALSSCNLSRIKPDQRGLLNMNLGAFSPNVVHQTRSQAYYSSAIRRFVSLNNLDLRSRPEIVFAVLVLFAYIESSMGNFHGFQCHVEGLTRFLVELQESMNDAVYKALLTAWMQVRFVVWWARAYFSTMDVHRMLPSIPLPDIIAGYSESIQGRRVSVLSIMCESHRLNSTEVLSHWVALAEGAQSINQGHTMPDTRGIAILQLAEEAKKLNEWLFHLPSSEQPLQLDLSDSNSILPHTAPVRFQSHDAALNFAYYVVARIMQCSGLFLQLNVPDFSRSRPSCTEERVWVELLVRVAKGVNLKDAISKNSYTIGFSSLMLAAILRCNSLSLGIEIENWLETLRSLHPTEEGAFPVYQTLGVVRAVNQQRMAGCEIFGVTLPVDDAGGKPKFTAYNSQSISPLLLHGKCLVSGELFTQCASIDL
ncbi:hypothetical protein BJX70DRAFT_261923 [Aspergillus crustosus]